MITTVKIELTMTTAVTIARAAGDIRGPSLYVVTAIPRTAVPRLAAHLSEGRFGLLGLGYLPNDRPHGVLYLNVSHGLANQQALARFYRVADSLPVLIWISGVDKLCTWFNRAWLDFVDRTMEQEIGNGWSENVFAEDLDRCVETYVDSFEARRPFRMEYRLRHHTGAYRWILDEGIPLYDATDEFAGYIGCCLDITDQKRTETELQRLLERERRVTQILQSAFLPPFLPKVKGIEFQAYYRAAEAEAQLGGDWYDAFVLRDGRIALSIGDVFGHGLDAAGAMVRLRETLRAVTGFIDNDPATILQLADRAFQKSHPEVVASAIFAIYDPATRRILMANAGHPRPALVRNGTATLIGTGDILLGISSQSAFSISEHRLEKDDFFILYTDGLIEIERDVVLGEREFLRVLEEMPIDAESIVQKIAGDKQQDDVAILVLSVVAPNQDPSWRFQADDASSAEHARNAFLAHLRQRGLSAEEVHAAVLVFGELVANVVRHAPGPIEIELYWPESELIIYVRDRGPEFMAAVPALPSDPMSEGGRGLFLVGNFAASQTVTRRFGGGNEVCVRLALADEQRVQSTDASMAPQA